MSGPPPLPPLPPALSYPHNPTPPPVPALPRDYSYNHESPPHFADPLVAPRPHKLEPDVPANMARTLDEQSNGAQYLAATSVPRGPSPANYTNPAAFRQPSPLPNPQGSSWGPWNQYQGPPMPQYPPQQQQFPQQQYPQQQYPQYPQQFSPQQPPQQYPQQPPPPQQYSQPPPQQYPPAQRQQSPPQQYPPPQQPQSPPQQYAPPPQFPPQRQQQLTPPQQYQSPRPGADILTPAMANLSFSAPQGQPRQRVQSFVPPAPAPAPAPSPPRPANAVPSLTAPLPAITSLTAALSSVQLPTHDPSLKIAWCRDVCFLVDRQQPGSVTEIPSGPVRILDPQLLKLSQVAVQIVIQLSSPAKMPQPMPIYIAEAIYLQATFAASGAYPDQVKQNPRMAFRGFEQAARGGYNAAWFRLGRDYENFNDAAHAKDCFERGVKFGVENCCYRMGMAHLMGQLGLPVSHENALPLLHRAATLASIDVPQPAYVFALLLLSEFSHVTIPEHLFQPYIPPSSSTPLEARKHLERAAYLNFAPAQYKLGHAYEFAQPPFKFDPLLSVQYYSLASQQGEIEADMALSKWFLCGAEGSFEKDEALAYTFAEKAARKGLPSAEFALGYYAEVGVGGPKDIEVARKWYTSASEHGNADAIDRLAALSQPSPQSLSRQEHDTITEATLIRKRTQAKKRSEVATGEYAPPHQTGLNAPQVIEVVRKNSTNYGPGPMQGPVKHAFNPPERTSSASAVDARSGLNNNGSPQLRPIQPGGRAYPNSHRYTLTDAPAAPIPGGGTRPLSVGGVRPAGRPPASRLQSGGVQSAQSAQSAAPAAPRLAKAGPATFAEMGIAHTKLEEKECVIM